MEFTHTNRGFAIGNFKDAYGLTCSIQESSSCSDEENPLGFLWLGVANAKPEILASDARILGLPTGGRSLGWIPYEIPKEVLLHTRMHLNETGVRELINTLQYWLDNNGYLPVEEEEEEEEVVVDPADAHALVEDMIRQKPTVESVLPFIRNTDISVYDRWDVYSKLVENDLLNDSDGVSWGYTECLVYEDNAERNEMDKFNMNRGETKTYVELYETIDLSRDTEEAFTEESIVEWMAKVLESAAASFTLDW